MWGLRDGGVEGGGGREAGPMRGMGCMWKLVMTYLPTIGEGIPYTHRLMSMSSLGAMGRGPGKAPKSVLKKHIRHLLVLKQTGAKL